MTPPLPAGRPCGPPTLSPVPLSLQARLLRQARVAGGGWRVPGRGAPPPPPAAAATGACCSAAVLVSLAAVAERQWRRTAQQASKVSQGSSQMELGGQPGSGWRKQRRSTFCSGSSSANGAALERRQCSRAAFACAMAGAATRICGAAAIFRISLRAARPPSHRCHACCCRCLCAGVQGLRLQDHGWPGQAGLPHEAGCAHQRPRAGAQADGQTTTSTAHSGAAAAAGWCFCCRCCCTVAARVQCTAWWGIWRQQYGALGAQNSQQRSSMQQQQPGWQVCSMCGSEEAAPAATSEAWNGQVAAGAGVWCQQAAEWEKNQRVWRVRIGGSRRQWQVQQYTVLPGPRHMRGEQPQPPALLAGSSSAAAPHTLPEFAVRQRPAPLLCCSVIFTDHLPPPCLPLPPRRAAAGADEPRRPVLPRPRPPQRRAPPQERARLHREPGPVGAQPGDREEGRGGAAGPDGRGEAAAAGPQAGVQDPQDVQPHQG
jgi:hypothetical protein